MIRLYTEKAIRVEVEKRLHEEHEKEELGKRLEIIEREIRELRQKVWCLEHPPVVNPKEAAEVCTSR